MTDSEHIGKCAVSHCISHLDKRYAKSHPTIPNGYLCPGHEYMSAKTADMLEYMRKAYLDQPKPDPVYPSPWSAKDLDRLTKGLAFEQTFAEVFGEGL